MVEALCHAGISNDAVVDIRWINSETLNEKNLKENLKGCSGILVPGGFGDRGIEGMIAAVQYARENAIPFFGICLGMQMAVIEFARHVLGKADANSAEFSETTGYPIIALMPDQVNITDKGGTMTEKGEDRRSRRSQKLLKKGLLELMREKKFSAISVRDVTERADMNRGTFYLHYPDTTSLLQSVETDMLAEAQILIDEHLAEFEAGGSLRPVFKPILDYIVEHRPEFEALFATNSTSNFTDRLQDLIHRNGVSLVQAKFHGVASSQMDFLINFIGYGLIGLIKTWFDQDMVIPRENLVQLADRLVNSAAEGVLSASGEMKSEKSVG